MASYTCGTCEEKIYGFEEFWHHVINAEDHDYGTQNEALEDCVSIDEPGVVEIGGKLVVECLDCRNVYRAIASECPDCGCEEVRREVW